ncbi:MAG TPA: class I mannose-6-phosphate isomerase [Candidatus Dormibacteraeota bacterium]|nr:class I mannose-6-phosphate isomerase [Candidatus Dormibacteraeota bacterium]
MSSEASRPGRAPARLAPIFLPRIWGARDLSPLFPERSREPEPVGEAWLTGNECVFETGEFAGRALGDVWPSLPEEWTGTRLRGLPRIPLLVKFIFPKENLSVQVHPDDEYAEQHEPATGGAGKTEMWYVVAAGEGAELCVGLRPGVTRESFERAIADGTVENCLARVPVRAGDAVFVPAGTAHTICPGVVLCEVQQHSNITYRVFDYNRVGADGKPRALHVRQALNVMTFGEQSGGLCDPVRLARGAVTETFFAACRHFAVERWEFRERIVAVTSPEHFDLLIFLEGKGRIDFSGGGEPYGPAQAWLLPAGLGAYQLDPESPTALLRAYVPDLNGFVQHLADERVEEAAWSRVVHP